MYFGELANKNESYQIGHGSGIYRAKHDTRVFLESLPLSMFAGLTKKQKQKNKNKLLDLVESNFEKFQEHCDTFGMGIEEEELTEEQAAKLLEFVKTELKDY